MCSQTANKNERKYMDYICSRAVVLHRLYLFSIRINLFYGFDVRCAQKNRKKNQTNRQTISGIELYEELIWGDASNLFV